MSLVKGVVLFGEKGQCYLVNYNYKTECKNCGAEIFWAKTLAGKNVPIDSDGKEVHFETCTAKQRQTNQAQNNQAASDDIPF